MSFAGNDLQALNIEQKTFDLVQFFGTDSAHTLIGRMIMEQRKREIREIVLDIIFGKEHTTYGASHFKNLCTGVAEIMVHRNMLNQPEVLQGAEARLPGTDKMIVEEVFWDLFVEKVITLGMNHDNPGYPWFRLHSDAKMNLKPT